jgi:hypothetical protein
MIKDLLKKISFNYLNHDCICFGRILYSIHLKYFKPKKYASITDKTETIPKNIILKVNCFTIKDKNKLSTNILKILLKSKYSCIFRLYLIQVNKVKMEAKKIIDNEYDKAAPALDNSLIKNIDVTKLNKNEAKNAKIIIFLFLFRIKRSV